MGVGRFREVDEDELHTVDACGYAHRVFGGVPQPGFWHAASVRDLQARFALRPEDVAICTYPKCGTTSRGDAWRTPVLPTIVLQHPSPNSPRIGA